MICDLICDLPITDIPYCQCAIVRVVRLAALTLVGCWTTSNMLAMIIVRFFCVFWGKCIIV